jgi:hypothetical protein
MRFGIAKLKDYLRAELLDRETVEETREFLMALAVTALQHRKTKVLICVHSSRPIFKVEEYHASVYLKELGARPEFKIALVSTRLDIRAAHEYIEVLAMQQGANVRSFADESQAAAWLRSCAEDEKIAQALQGAVQKSP